MNHYLWVVAGILVTVFATMYPALMTLWLFLAGFIVVGSIVHVFLDDTDPSAESGEIK